MRSRPVRMTDAQWADAKLIGMQVIREFVTKQAARVRAKIDKAKEK